LNFIQTLSQTSPFSISLSFGLLMSVHPLPPPSQIYSLASLLSHFQNQDTLQIPGNERLIIKKFPPSIYNDLPDSAVLRVESILNRFLLPIGRNIELVIPAQKPEIRQNARSISIAFPKKWGVKLLSKTEPFIARADHLFKMMLSTSTFSLTIAPWQPFGLVINEKDLWTANPSSNSY
jgi:hypothetical protein